ncbi:MAG: DUF6054 family protein [Bacillota bacterium]
MQQTIMVSLALPDAMRVCDDAIVCGSLTGERIDQYVIDAPNGGRCAVAVYEKHFYRAGNRLTLTIVGDDFAGVTRIHCIGGGGGEGLFRFDWGASKSFEGTIERALEPYRV